MAIPSYGAYYGKAPKRSIILIDGLDCDGSERNIGLCKKRPWGVNICQHKMDAGLICLRKLRQTIIIFYVLPFFYEHIQLLYDAIYLSIFLVLLARSNRNVMPGSVEV